MKKLFLAIFAMLMCGAFCGCIASYNCTLINASGYTIELTPSRSLFSDVKTIKPLEEFECRLPGRGPYYKIHVPETGAIYKYIIDDGTLGSSMAFYEDGSVGFAIYSFAKPGFVMIAPDENGWVYLPWSNTEITRRQCFSEEEWAQRKLVTSDRIRLWGDIDAASDWFSGTQLVAPIEEAKAK